MLNKMSKLRRTKKIESSNEFNWKLRFGPKGERYWNEVLGLSLSIDLPLWLGISCVKEFLRQKPDLTLTEFVDVFIEQKNVYPQVWYWRNGGKGRCPRFRTIFHTKTFLVFPSTP